MLRMPSPSSFPQAVVVHYLALPDPVGIPNGLILTFQYDERQQPYLSGLKQAPPGTPTEALLENGGPYDIAVRLWQVPSYGIEEVTRMAAAVAVVEAATAEGKPLELSSKPPEIPGGSGKATAIVTVAEVAAFSDERPDEYAPEIELELDDLSDPLLRSIHCLQQLTRAYRIGTDCMIKEATYYRFPKHVPRASRSLTPPKPLAFNGVVNLSHDNLLGRPPAPVSDDEAGEMFKAVQLLAAGDPALLVQERLLEARRLVLVEGNLAGAVIESAVAAETLLDAVIGLLLWERDGKAPASDGPTESASAVMSRPLRSRVKSDFHPHLGGRWDPSANGPIRDWDQKVAHLRGRVVHRGYRPRGSEVEESMQAVGKLVEYLEERISVKAKLYPRTAMMIVGAENLEKRNAWRFVRAFAEKQAPNEPPWRDAYYAWRDRVDADVARRT